MASPMEKMAASMNFSAFAKAEGLKKRILWTIFILIIYRLGTYIPLPGVDATALKSFFAMGGSGLLNMFDMFAGGAFSRMTIFALNIIPYISASIIIQLLSMVSKNLEQLRKEGESGRQKLNQYTRYLTVFICAIQAYGFAVGLEGIDGAILNPGTFLSRFSIVLTMVGGTMLVMWLGEQITARGVGNGSSLIIFTGIVSGLPSAIFSTLNSAASGEMQPITLAAVVLTVVGLLLLTIYVEGAKRKIVIQYPRRQVGNKVYGGTSSYMPLKLNTASVMPPIFAGAVIGMPMLIMNFIANSRTLPDWAQAFMTQMQRGAWGYMALYTFLIVFFAFFYTAISFNPKETAENLKKYGGFIPGVRPGDTTASYFDYVLTRLTVVGAAFLVIVCVVPDYFVDKWALPFSLGGTAVIIVVNVILETFAQIQSHLISYQYEGLFKKAEGAGRFR